MNVSASCIARLLAYGFFLSVNVMPAFADGFSKEKDCIISYEGLNLFGFAKEKYIRNFDLTDLSGAIILSRPVLECSSVQKAAALYLDVSVSEVVNPGDIVRFFERNGFGHPIEEEGITFHPTLYYLNPYSRTKMKIGFLCFLHKSEFFSEFPQEIDVCDKGETPLLLELLPLKSPSSRQCHIRIMFKSTGRFMQVVSLGNSMNCSSLEQDELFEQVSIILSFFEYLD